MLALLVSLLLLASNAFSNESSDFDSLLSDALESTDVVPTNVVPSNVMQGPTANPTEEISAANDMLVSTSGPDVGIGKDAKLLAAEIVDFVLENCGRSPMIDLTSNTIAPPPMRNTTPAPTPRDDELKFKDGDESMGRGDDSRGRGGKTTNVALGKIAVQSSVCCGNAIASRAVDGNKDGNWKQHSVTHTNVEFRPFWRVDLGRSCDVDRVVIYNRVDCCGERLQNFDVVLQDFVSKPLESYFHGLKKQNVFEFGDAKRPPVRGVRYVRVQLRGRNYLSLAEVEVIGRCDAERSGWDNVALGKYAFQSSTLAHVRAPIAAKAIDGVADGRFDVGSTTHTKSQSGAFWEVDLGRTAEITAIVIFNRVDCCSARLANFKVILYDFAHQPVQTIHHPGGGKQIEYGFLVVPPKNARYVRVQLLGTNFLHLAEVEVFGKQVGGYENVALFRQARQSSTLNHPFTPIAEKAVDGVVDGQFNVRSTTHTNGQVKPWWEVNLGAEEIIYGVTLYNRLDCCGNRLQNFDVVVTNNSGKVTKTTHFGVGVRITYPVSIPDGVVARKVKVQLRGNAPLQLAEVQVWAGARTCGGTGDGARCAFPFVYDGVTYRACTHVEADRPWCATKSGDVAVHKEWGFCFC
ncbi:uncharacterized protein [Oscarella lobularis]|uniref:uncharacterized protein n=1 Tax=Oscarella lobularis TaxID=121494 RepID=UPI00331388F8